MDVQERGVVVQWTPEQFDAKITVTEWHVARYTCDIASRNGCSSSPLNLTSAEFLLRNASLSRLLKAKIK